MYCLVPSRVRTTEASSRGHCLVPAPRRRPDSRFDHPGRRRAGRAEDVLGRQGNLLDVQLRDVSRGWMHGGHLKSADPVAASVVSVARPPVRNRLSGWRRRLRSPRSAA